MSSILAQWLSSEIGLVNKIDGGAIEKECSSGYLFGKLLDCLGLQDDFEMHFVNVKESKTDFESILKNYQGCPQ